VLSGSIHRQEVIRRKVPGEIPLTVRDHLSATRPDFAASAHDRVGYIHRADIGKALGPQQFPNDLRYDAGYGVFSASGSW
jgi:hypothetical protein